MSSSLGPVTCGRLGFGTVLLGQHARRHYWLAPRSDDAVGTGHFLAPIGWRTALARLQQRDVCLRRFGRLTDRCTGVGWQRRQECRLKARWASVEPDALRISPSLFGSRLSGDLTGFGRCMTRIKRADTASRELNVAPISGGLQQQPLLRALPVARLAGPSPQGCKHG